MACPDKFSFRPTNLTPGLHFSDLPWEYFLPNEFMLVKNPRLWGTDEILSRCELLTWAWPCQGCQCLRPMGIAGLPSPVWGKITGAASSSRMTVSLETETPYRDQNKHAVFSPGCWCAQPARCQGVYTSVFHALILHLLPTPVSSHPELCKLPHRTS